MVDFSNTKKLKNIPKILFLILIIVGLFFGAYYTGITREYCGKDINCFSEKAESCKPAEVYLSRSTNVYYYKTTPSFGNKCDLFIKFERAQEGTLQEHKELLEGKSMTCTIPKNEMRELDILEMNNIMQYCTGPLKESLYELIVKRMYELIIVNLGEIAEEARNIMKV